MSEPTPETGTAEVARPGSLAGRAWLRTATPRLRTRPRPPSCGQPRVRRGMQPDGPRMTGADCQDVHAFQLIALVQPSRVDDVGSPHVLGVVFSPAARRLGSYPRSRLNAISARTSFGKQLPP